MKFLPTLRLVLVDESSSTVSPTSPEEISNSSSVNNTSYESSSPLPDIPFDSTTSSFNSTAGNETFVDSTVFEDFNSTLSEDESFASTNATSIDDEIDVTQNSTIVDEEYSNETISIPDKIPSAPICDRSCRCGRKCPYGFEIIDDQCKCDPPCKVTRECETNFVLLLIRSLACRITNALEMIHVWSLVKDNLDVSRAMTLCMVGGRDRWLDLRRFAFSRLDRPTRCYQPRDDGYHDDTLRYHNRWYYHPDQDTCHLFVYRGLGGNENNFLSLNECHLECISKCTLSSSRCPFRVSCSLCPRTWSRNMSGLHSYVVLRWEDKSMFWIRIFRL